MATGLIDPTFSRDAKRSPWPRAPLHVAAKQEPRMAMNSFLKHASIYGLASLLLQVGHFLLLPLYLRCLSPREYGLLEVVSRCAETIGTLLLFGGFRQALMAFYQQATNERRRRQVVCSA